MTTRYKNEKMQCAVCHF